MRFYLGQQAKEFPAYLEDLTKANVMHYNISQLKMKRSFIEINTSKSYENLDFGILFSYNIFPYKIMTSLTQWTYEQRVIQQGDNIVQQVCIPPFESFSIKLIFGVRIKEIIDEPTRKGYSYETLEGHVERGISTFTIEKALTGEIIFVIQTFSEPAELLLRLTGPFFSLPYQDYCTKKALNNTKRLIEHGNKK